MCISSKIIHSIFVSVCEAFISRNHKPPVDMFFYYINFT